MSFRCHTLSSCSFSPDLLLWETRNRGNEESGAAHTSLWITVLHCVQLSIQAQTLNPKPTPNRATAQADFSNVKNSNDP